MRVERPSELNALFRPFDEKSADFVSKSIFSGVAVQDFAQQVKTTIYPFFCIGVLHCEQMEQDLIILADFMEFGIINTSNKALAEIDGSVIFIQKVSEHFSKFVSEGFAGASHSK